MVDLFEPHAKNDVKNEALVHMKDQFHKKVVLNNKFMLQKVIIKIKE